MAKPCLRNALAHSETVRKTFLTITSELRPQPPLPHSDPE